MRARTKLLITICAVAALAAAGTAAVAASGSPGASSGPKKNKSEVIHLKLTPSSAQLATCMPDAKVSVAVALTADKRGFDVLRIRALHLPPNTSFTVFLLEQAGAPFGAAEYIGDFTTNAHGNAHNTYRLIVQEAFSSTLVNGVRQRVDLNRIGSWFADPNDDNFCLGPNSPPTPFDGDGQAGVQAFNSANADPLPAP